MVTFNESWQLYTLKYVHYDGVSEFFATKNLHFGQIEILKKNNYKILQNSKF